MSLETIEIKEDSRGKVAQIFDMGTVGEVLFTSINPGMVRGNHYHKKKREYFCVIEGRGVAKLRNVLTGAREEYDLSGDSLMVLRIEPGWTHNIKNVGANTLKFIEWGTIPFDPTAPDSYKEEV